MTFHTIFPSRQSPFPQKPLPKIIVDHREKNSFVVAELLNKPVSLEFQQLPIADYLIHDVAVERKTVADFKSSIMNKRIFDQIRNLRQHEKHLFILEGILDEDIYKIGMHENAFRGFLLSLLLSKVPLLFTHNASDTAKYLCVLASKPQKQSPPSLRPSRLISSPEEQAQFILEGFPGIGPVAAKELLARFGSLKNVFTASEDEFKEVLGKRAAQFKDLLERNATY